MAFPNEQEILEAIEIAIADGRKLHEVLNEQNIEVETSVVNAVLRKAIAAESTK
jgi:hypothetical protein